MTKTQFRNALEQLGLTQGQAAELLHKSLRTVAGYANGQPIPFLVANAVENWLKYGLADNARKRSAPEAGRDDAK